MKLLATSVNDVFGHIDSSQFAGGGNLANNPAQGLGKFIGTGINLFLIVAGLVLLLFMMWGAFDWIVSGGEKERVAKAQGKITNALIGMLLIFVVLTVWTLVTGQLLNLVKVGPGGGWEFHIPTLGQ